MQKMMASAAREMQANELRLQQPSVSALELPWLELFVL